MTCDRACEALWPDPAATGPLGAPRHYRHYERCSLCRRFFAIQRVLERRLARLHGPAVPQLLEGRVRAAVRAAG